MKGTVAPESCPPGTFSNTLGLTNIYTCTNCTPGLFCNGSALTAPSGECSPRYYCTGKAENPAPQDGITGGNCTPGHFCPGKTPNPIPCEVCNVKKVTLYCGRNGNTFAIFCWIYCQSHKGNFHINENRRHFFLFLLLSY